VSCFMITAWLLPSRVFPSTPFVNHCPEVVGCDGQVGAPLRTLAARGHAGARGRGPGRVARRAVGRRAPARPALGGALRTLPRRGAAAGAGCALAGVARARARRGGRHRAGRAAGASAGARGRPACGAAARGLRACGRRGCRRAAGQLGLYPHTPKPDRGSASACMRSSRAWARTCTGEPERSARRSGPGACGAAGLLPACRWRSARARL